MVNYVCRTCLYVSDNEFSFKRLEKVKPVLELFLPEMKTFMGKYSLICEQCYYFLKNVEKFKAKCLETQKKIYSMNIETIKDKHEAVLQSVAREVFMREQQRHIQREPLPLFNLGAKLKRSKIESSSKRASKKLKNDPYNSVTSTITSPNEITLTNLLNTSLKPVEELKEKKESTKSNECLSSSTADDFLKLFKPREDVDNMTFQDFTENDVDTNNEVEENKDSANSEKQEVIINYEDEEYMSKSDLVAAGFFSDDSNKSTGKPAEKMEAGAACEDDVETIEIEISDDENSVEAPSKRVEIKIVDSCKENTLRDKKDGDSYDNSMDSAGDKLEPECRTSVIVKKEILEEDNPGFFNKQSADGYYRCRLCDKHYKTSQGLYMHTKKVHSNEVKFHHCSYCSFFTIWRTALIEHNLSFHAEIFEPNNSSLAKCNHCSFETRSKDQLSHHIMENHVLNKFIQCHLCRSRFSDKCSFSEHVKKEHLSLEAQKDLNKCTLCNKIILKEEYTNHMETHHKI